MTRKVISPIAYAVLITGIVLGLVNVVQAAAGPIDPLNNYAWGTNIGWVNFAPTHGGGVTVFADHLEGFAWAENIGWIRLGTHTGGSPHIYGNSSAGDYGVNQDGAGNLSGYAWGTNVGWINFNPSHSQVTIDAAGNFDGYAWAENVGWIHFKGGTGATAYGVVAQQPTAITLASFEIEAGTGTATINWETGTEIDNAGFNLYRAASADGPWLKINSELIPAEGGELTGTSYSYVDTPGRGTFYYQLEDIDSSGISTRHDEILIDLGPTIRRPWYRPVLRWVGIY